MTITQMTKSVAHTTIFYQEAKEGMSIWQGSNYILNIVENHTVCVEVVR